MVLATKGENARRHWHKLFEKASRRVGQFYADRHQKMSISCPRDRWTRRLVVTILLHILMVSHPPGTAASQEKARQQWLQIMQEKFKCLEVIINASLPEEGGLYCEPIWDNLMCWPLYVKAGENVTQPCPTYIEGFNPLERATRSCTEDGTWEEHPSTELNTSWTDFLSCLKKIDPTVPAIIEEHIPIVIQISTVGYSISLGTLIIATTIMILLKKLHCQRNTIHINLFISFIVRSVISLLRNTLLVKHFAFPSDIKYTADGKLQFITEGTHWECKLLNTLWQYSLNANYMWIFVEGLYLHTLIFFAIFSQSRKFFKLYIIIGWVFPIIFIIIWVAVRISDNDTLCWNTHVMGYYWILNAPIVSSISVNFFFFLNIIRVLFTKIRDCNTRDPRRYRKLAKSTLVLIPLFGVYYIFFIVLDVYKEPEIAVVHMYIEVTINSFQGTVVAFLFCFLNGEVRAEIFKKWHRHLLRRQSVVSGRCSRALSTSSYLIGRDRTSLSLGVPLCDVPYKEDRARSPSHSSLNNSNGRIFHKVSSIPKMVPNSTNSTMNSLHRVSSASKVTFSRVDSIIEVSQDSSGCLPDDEPTITDRQNVCNGDAETAQNDESKLLLLDSTKDNLTSDTTEVPKSQFKALSLLWDIRTINGRGIVSLDNDKFNSAQEQKSSDLPPLSIVEDDASVCAGTEV